MTDQPRDRRTGPETATGHGSRTGAPRWVKLFGIVVAVLIVLAVAVMLVGGGVHGPGRHLSSDVADNRPRPVSTAVSQPSEGLLRIHLPHDGGT